MGTTSNGLPWPAGTDPVVNGDDAIKALADALNVWVLDTGWVTTGLTVTPAANFTVGSYRLRKLGKRAIGRISITYTGSNLVADASGNFTDTQMFTLPAGYATNAGIGWPLLSLAQAGTRQWFGRTDNSTGVCVITHGLPTQTLSAGTALDCYIDHPIT